MDRFATVAVVDTNGLLRGQKICGQDLEGVLVNGMGMSAAQLALDPTDVFLTLPGVTDDRADFRDSRLVVDQLKRCEPAEALRREHVSRTIPLRQDETGLLVLLKRDRPAELLDEAGRAPEAG